MDGLTEGRIVHYVLPDGQSVGEHRPAIVVKVWDKEAGTINLTVFTDHTNDYRNDPNQHPNLPHHPGESGIMWATSVRYSENHEQGTWHWIEKA